MNTALIRQWSMEGAAGDLDRGFGSIADAPEIAPESSPRSRGTAYDVPILLKRADDEDWRPLGGSEDATADASDVADRLLGY